MLNRLPSGRGALLVAATACWGAGTVVTKEVLESVSPLTLLPIQLASSCVFLLGALLISRTSVSWSPPIRRLAVLGVLNPGAAYALGLLGLASITASMSVLIWAAEPVLILVLAVLLLRERFRPALAATVGVAVLGVLLVVYQPGADGDLRGVALTFAAVAGCALYTVLTRRLLLADASLAVAFIQQLAAVAFAITLVGTVEALGGEGWSTAGISAATWAGAAMSGVLYYGAAFWLYIGGLRRVSASVAGAFLPLIPVFGVAAAYLVGERLTIEQWIGAILVVGATAVGALREASAADTPAEDRSEVARPRAARG